MAYDPTVIKSEAQLYATMINDQRKKPNLEHIPEPLRSASLEMLRWAERTYGKDYRDVCSDIDLKGALYSQIGTALSEWLGCRFI